MKLALILLVAGCASGPAPHDTANDALVYLTSNVNDAQVYVDGRYIGSVTLVKRGIAIDPGKHRVEIRHDDYFSRTAELDLKRAEKKQLSLDLAPVLP